ncbi:MAG: (2Fe-2S)-binding protein [Hyphomicrobiales bacterium]|nr:MAG: (2Fe-2S)-binding protein [Hyphomicrobiales bacterium]
MDASLTVGSLQAVIDELRARNGNLPAAQAGLTPDMLTPDELAADIGRLEAWLDVQGLDANGMDQKTRAAYMIGGLAYAACSWMAALELTGKAPPIRRVGFAQERYTYRFADGTERDYVRYPICFEVGEGPAAHRTTLEQMFAPIIAALMVTSGLSAGAQWRLVADNVASAFLYAGKGFGQPERGMEVARDIIAEGRLDNGKTGFIEVQAGDAAEHFLVRGGCCRYYTTSDAQGEYCTSCVLRKRDDQIARYTRYLADTQAAAASA